MNTLKTPTFEAPKLSQGTQFSPARIMSPAELKAAVADRRADEIDRIGNRWMLCGDTKASTFDAMRAQPDASIPFRLSAFRSSIGNAFVVMTHQIANSQHRFVLPVWVPVVRSFIEAIARDEAHSFMFGRAGGEEAMVLPGLNESTAFAPLRALWSEYGALDAERCIAELPLVMQVLGRADTIPSMVSGYAVNALSVSVVIPTEHLLDELYAHRPPGTVH